VTDLGTSCMMCRHFRIDLGWGGTEATPGEVGSVHCADALQPPFDDADNAESRFREWVRFGNSCGGFEAAVDLPRETLTVTVGRKESMKLMCCWFKPVTGECVLMILRGHLDSVRAANVCAQLGLPISTGEFSCLPVPDPLVELFAEHAERVLTQAKAQELFGDKWQAVAW